MLAILVVGNRQSEKHGPIVGWILTDMGFGLSFLLLPPLPVPPDEVAPLPLGGRLLLAELDGGVAIAWISRAFSTTKNCTWLGKRFRSGTVLRRVVPKS